MSIATGTVTLTPALSAGLLLQTSGALLEGNFDDSATTTLGMKVVEKIGKKQNAIGLPAYFMHRTDEGILFCLNGEVGELSLDELKHAVETSARETGLLQ